MLTSQKLKSLPLDNVGINGLNTQSNAASLDGTWLTEASNIRYTKGGKLSYRKGLKESTAKVKDGNDTTIIDGLVEFRTAGKIFCSKTVSKTIDAVDSWASEILEVEHPYWENRGVTSYDESDSFTPVTFVSDSNSTNAHSQAKNNDTPNLSRWSWTEFNEKLIGVQGDGVEPIIYHKIGSNYQWDRLTQLTGHSSPSSISTFDPTCILGHYGRVWVGGISEEKDTLFWSDFGNAESWDSPNDSGYINLRSVWGQDEIVSIKAYGGKLAIFGKHNIALYNNPDIIESTVTSSMHLDEVIKGIGCIDAESIQAVGEDLVFLSKTGVRSLKRTATYDKLPLQELSTNIQDDIIDVIYSGSRVRGAYKEDEGLYILSFLDRSDTFVFDLKYNTPDSITKRIYKWSINKDKDLQDMLYTDKYGLIFARESLFSYSGYTDEYYDTDTRVRTNKPYEARVSTGWLDLGAGATSVILKKAIMVFAGGRDSNITFRLRSDFSYDSIIDNTFPAMPATNGEVAEYSVSSSSGDYSEYSTSTTVGEFYEYGPTLGYHEKKLPLGGRAKYLKIEMIGQANGYDISLASFNLLYKIGKTR